MREAHPTERAVGISYYVSDADGVGGRLRASPEDFRVREREAFDTEPLDADYGAYPHVVCRVELRGWDTNDFARRLSDELGISRERVTWAGTKDKRAVTTQLLSVSKLDTEGVDRLSAADIRDADVEVLGRAGRAIHAGDLAGNDFSIVVSDAEHPENADSVTDDLRAFAGEDAAAASDGPVTVGVPNFFGQQRFGSRRPVTHEVGFAIVRGDWAGAVMAYLGEPDEAEPADTREARAFVDRERDWGAALERVPDRLRYERAMLHTLDEHDAPPEIGETAATAALDALPGSLQQLFVHAAQSALFNEILSERLARGLPFDRPVAGDVVCFADSDAPEGLALPDTDRIQRVTEGRVETVARHCERGRAFVTAPLVGTDTEFADGEPGAITREVLTEHDLSREDFANPEPYGSAGTRRAVLVRTDLTVGRDPLSLSFALPKGSYATTVLREYLKVDPVDLG